MSETNEAINGTAGAWYSKQGEYNDVILSTRVRLARNLANFPFPGNFKGDDADRIQSLVFDSFSHCSEPELFQAVSTQKLDPLGKQILAERGIAEEGAGTGIVMRSDGKVSCTVNSSDHVRISSFVPGLDCDTAFALCRSVDDSMQQNMQFAASYDFGFLTSSLQDAGSGMKLSVRVHLPSLSFTGKTDVLLKYADQKGFVLSACFGSGLRAGSSLGAYYQISNKSSMAGNELDQLTSLSAFGKYLYEREQKARTECTENRPTAVRDIILRSYAVAKFSRLIPLRESVELISGIKWGIDLGLLTGITDSELFALLYRIQEGHLQFVLQNGSFSFEKDVEENSAARVERLRSLILQEAFGNVSFIA